MCMETRRWFEFRVGATTVVPEGKLMIQDIKRRGRGEYTHVIRLHQDGNMCTIRTNGDGFDCCYPDPVRKIPGRHTPKDSGSRVRGLIAMVRREMLVPGNILRVEWISDEKLARKSLAFTLVTVGEQPVISVIGCKPGVQCTGDCDQCDGDQPTKKVCSCGVGEDCRLCQDRKKVAASSPAPRACANCPVGAKSHGSSACEGCELL